MHGCEGLWKSTLLFWVGGWSAQSKIRQSSALLGLGAGPDLGKKQGLSQYSESATINKLTDQSNWLPCELTLLQTDSLISRIVAAPGQKSTWSKVNLAKSTPGQKCIWSKVQLVKIAPGKSAPGQRCTRSKVDLTKSSPGQKCN